MMFVLKLYHHQHRLILDLGLNTSRYKHLLHAMHLKTYVMVVQHLAVIASPCTLMLLVVALLCRDSLHSHLKMLSSECP